jgi:hypothetical protein
VFYVEPLVGFLLAQAAKTTLNDDRRTEMATVQLVLACSPPRPLRAQKFRFCPAGDAVACRFLCRILGVLRVFGSKIAPN